MIGSQTQSQMVQSNQESTEKSQLKTSRQQLEKIKKSVDTARAVRKKLQEKTNKLDMDIKEIRKQLIAGAVLIRNHEVWVRDLKIQLDEVNYTLVEKRKSLKLRRKKIGQILLGLHRVSLYPPEALIVRPIVPGDVVRSAILLRAVVGEFEREIKILRNDLNTLAKARKDAEQRRLELSIVKRELESQRKLMRTLMGRKSRLRRRVLAKSKRSKERLKLLVQKTHSIRDLVLRLERLREKRKIVKQDKKFLRSGERGLLRMQGPESELGKPMDTARGKLVLPAVGRMVAKYGEKGEEGSTHKGLSIVTGLGAQIVAPYDGRVAFAGLFRGYGNLLIIEHNDGYHTLLSGMKEINSVIGQWLVAGEPVGRMIDKSAENMKPKPLLYMEIRHDGQAINPLPWLAVQRMKKNDG